MGIAVGIVVYYIVGAVSTMGSFYTVFVLWNFIYYNNNINTRLLLHLHSGQLIESIASFPNSQRLPCVLFTTLRNYGSLYLCYTLFVITLHCYKIMFENSYEQKHRLSVWYEVAVVLLPLSSLANVQDVHFISTSNGAFCIHTTDSKLIGSYFMPMWISLFASFILFCLMVRKVLSLGSISRVFEDHGDFIVYVLYDSGIYILLTFFLWMPKSFIRVFADWEDSVYYVFYLTNFIVGILYFITFLCTRHRVVALHTYFKDEEDVRMSSRPDGQLNLDDVVRHSASDEASGDYGLYREKINNQPSTSFSVSQAAQYLLGLPPAVTLPAPSRSASTNSNKTALQGTRITETELSKSRPSSLNRSRESGEGGGGGNEPPGQLDGAGVQRGAHSGVE